MEQLDKKKAMEELGLDEDVFGELLRDFLSEAEAQIKKLGETIEAGNYDEIVQIGHSLKGMAGNLRIIPMQDLARSIEELAKESKDKQAIIKKYQAVKESLKDLREAV